MRYNLIIGKISNCEVVLDLWFGSFPQAYQMFEDLVDGVCVGYYIHIVNENGKLMKEKINPVNIPLPKAGK